MVNKTTFLHKIPLARQDPRQEHHVLRSYGRAKLRSCPRMPSMAPSSEGSCALCTSHETDSSTRLPMSRTLKLVPEYHGVWNDKCVGPEEAERPSALTWHLQQNEVQKGPETANQTAPCHCKDTPELQRHH